MIRKIKDNKVSTKQNRILSQIHEHPLNFAVENY